MATIRVIASATIPMGVMALMKGRAFVWVGAIGSPIEDIILDVLGCDAVMLHPADADRFKAFADAR